MDTIKPLLDNIVIFLLLILVGYILSLRKMVSPQLKNDISTILLKVAIPALMINSMTLPYNPALTRQGLATLGLIFFFILLGVLVGAVFCRLTKIDRSQRGVMMVATGFSNMLFMGIPIVNAMYGDEGVFLASFAGISFNILLYSVGQSLLGSSQEGFKIKWKEMFLTPIMLGIVIGIMIYRFQPALPVWASTGLDMIGSLTTPLGMMTVGLRLGESPLRDMFSQRINWLATGIRLILMPALALIILKLLPMENMGIVPLVVLIMVAMPILSNLTMMATKYGGDTAFASQSTTLSTILCLLTTPVILRVGQLFLG